MSPNSSLTFYPLPTMATQCEPKIIHFIPLDDSINELFLNNPCHAILGLTSATYFQDTHRLQVNYDCKKPLSFQNMCELQKYFANYIDLVSFDYKLRWSNRFEQYYGELTVYCLIGGNSS